MQLTPGFSSVSNEQFPVTVESVANLKKYVSGMIEIVNAKETIEQDNDTYCKPVLNNNDRKNKLYAEIESITRVLNKMK